MNTYENLKIVIIGGKKSKDDLLAMMDVFLMRGRITPEQYNELFEMLPADPAPVK